MCGRFNVEQAPLARWLLQALGVEYAGPDNHNAAPTEWISVVRTGSGSGLEATRMRWWLTPHWAKAVTARYSMFNARRETVATSPAFREPFRRHRCVVPVSGFYEWTGKSPGKQPWYIHPEVDAGLLLAGVWDRWSDPAGDETLESFAVITTAAHPALQFVHDRQPVMLSIEAARRWLAPDAASAELTALLEPAIPVGLDVVPVSSRVNDARHKEPACTEPTGEPVTVCAAPGTSP